MFLRIVFFELLFLFEYELYDLKNRIFISYDLREVIIDHVEVV